MYHATVWIIMSHACRGAAQHLRDVAGLAAHIAARRVGVTDPAVTVSPPSFWSHHLDHLEPCLQRCRAARRVKCGGGA